MTPFPSPLHICYFNPDVSQMRPHLIECLERAKMVSFPLAKARRIPVGNILKGVHEVTIFGICRLPNEALDQ